MSVRLPVLLLLIAWGVTAIATPARAVTLPGPVVDVMWLYEHLDEVLVLDVRSDTDSFTQRRRGKTQLPFNPCGVRTASTKEPVSGHIPGAILVPWQEVMADRELEGTTLSMMVPTREAFQALMRRAGVNDDSTVVIASEGTSTIHMAFAARLYWTLKYYGKDRIAILDGGTGQWRKMNRRMRFNQTEATPGNFTIRQERKEILATTADVLAMVEEQSGQLVDNRETDYFEGITRYEKFVPSHGEGHIPEAKNLPFMLLLDGREYPTFLPPHQVFEAFTARGILLHLPTVFYCNLGVQGSLGWFVLSEIFGNPNVRLYDGSMHAWTQDPTRQVDGF